MFNFRVICDMFHGDIMYCCCLCYHFCRLRRFGPMDQFFGSLEGGAASQGFNWDPSKLYNMVAGHAPAAQQAVYDVEE